ncbi:MAG: hypothetical protein WC869_12385 [Phycisphaerae bacterium]|jgi:hypothetical protein
MKIDAPVRRILIACAALLISAAWAVAAEAEAGLAQRYSDLAGGYSICPPAGADRVQQNPARREVVWTGRDPRMGAVLWALSVVRSDDTALGGDLKAFSQILRERFQAQKALKVESCQMARIGGRDVIDIRGQLVAEGRLWQRQVWLPMGGQQLLIVTVTGPSGDKGKLIDMIEASAGSVEVVDAAARKAHREAGLAAGRTLLAGLSESKLAAAVAREDQWFRMDVSGAPVGFMLVREKIEPRGDIRGLDVKAWTMVKSADGGFVTGESDFFASADRKSEQWSLTHPPEGGKATRLVGQTGSKRGQTIECTATVGGKTLPTSTRMLAESMEQVYLPNALGALLGRLVETSQAGSYAFAVYNAATNEMDVRTFSVVGPEKIQVGSAQVAAVKVTERMAEDADAAEVWLDKGGLMLRTRSPGGMVIERSSREEILRQLPQAKGLIEGIK